jgi:predicted AAA+ superfamily ATPase
MKISEVDAELVALNPWWRDPQGWEDLDVQLGAARSSLLSYDPRPLRDITPGGLYILRGPRRVGKSTALKLFIASRLRNGFPPRSILHVSVEGRSAQDLADIVRRGGAAWLEGDAGERIWVIDEITGVQGPWPEQIKRLRDSDPGFSADTVIITGSSASRFDEARKLLAGRRNADHSDRTLFQMGFTDVARELGAELPESPKWRAVDMGDPSAIEAAVHEYRPWITGMVDAWDRYLEVGGYPQAVSAEKEAQGSHREAVLTEALWDVIHGDAFAGAGLTHTQTQTILRSLSSSLSSLFSVQGLASAVGMAFATAERRLDALRRAFVAFPVHREQGLSPKPQSQSKWYFTDPRLARLAADLGAGSPPNDTVLSEQQIALALLRALDRESPGAAVRHDRLLYYRSGTGAEIDFVSPSFSSSCVESKFVDRGWGRAFQTIGASGRTSGIVATRSGAREHNCGWALPAGLVAFLFGS